MARFTIRDFKILRPRHSAEALFCNPFFCHRSHGFPKPNSCRPSTGVFEHWGSYVTSKRPHAIYRCTTARHPFLRFAELVEPLKTPPTSLPRPTPHHFSKTAFLFVHLHPAFPLLQTFPSSSPLHPALPLHPASLGLYWASIKYAIHSQNPCARNLIETNGILQQPRFDSIYKYQHGQNAHRHPLTLITSSNDKTKRCNGVNA